MQHRQVHGVQQGGEGEHSQPDPLPPAGPWSRRGGQVGIGSGGVHRAASRLDPRRASPPWRARPVGVREAGRVGPDHLVTGHPDRVRRGAIPHTAQIGQRDRGAPSPGAGVHPRQRLVQVGHHPRPHRAGGQVPRHRGHHPQVEAAGRRRQPAHRPGARVGCPQHPRPERQRLDAASRIRRRLPRHHLAGSGVDPEQRTAGSPHPERPPVGDHRQRALGDRDPAGYPAVTEIDPQHIPSGRAPYLSAQQVTQTLSPWAATPDRPVQDLAEADLAADPAGGRSTRQSRSDRTPGTHTASDASARPPGSRRRGPDRDARHHLVGGGVDPVQGGR